MENLNLQIDSNITKDLDKLSQGQLSLFEQIYNPDVLDCLSSLSNDEVFTSPKLANQMLDLLPHDIWSNPKATFLDPVCKSGVFLREIVKRLDKGLAKQIADRQTRINHILKNQIFGIAITQLTALLSRRSVYCAKNANSPLSICDDFDNHMGNIIFGQVYHEFKDGKCTECGASQAVFGHRDGLENHAYAFIHRNKDNVFKELEKMQFDVIIGNPPYQLNDGGGTGSGSAMPIYQKFVQQAKKLSPNYLIMITPSRWFAGGRGLDDFRDEMLNDDRIKVLVDYIDSNDCFPGVDISGGISYFLWDKKHNDKCLIRTIENGNIMSEKFRYLKESGSGTFIRFNEAVSILDKINKHQEKSFSELVSSSKPFGLRSFFRGKIKQTECENISVFGSNGVTYISEENITNNIEMIDKYKVYIAKAYGERVSSNFWVLGKPFLGEPNTICTETYLAIGLFDNEIVCQNVMSYVRTRFFRFLVLLKKNTQNSSKSTYQFVPQQDFNRQWTDLDLYIKYGLSKQDIEFIEKMVREMPDESNISEKKTRTKSKKQEALDLESSDE